MREFLLTSALMLATVSVFAAKPFKVTKGSLDVFKQDVTATWVIDLSEAQFVNNGIFANSRSVSVSVAVFESDTDNGESSTSGESIVSGS